jgi:hypothetical protein
MKWGMWGAHAGMTALVVGTLLSEGRAWRGWRALVAWAGVFLVTVWWEYIAVMSWAYWTEIERREREREDRDREERRRRAASD